MNRSWWYRFSFFLVLIVVSIMTITPTLLDFDPEKSSFPVKSKINLGLDLQGGLYMVLGIDFKKVYADEVKNYISKVQTTLKDEGIASTIGDLSAIDPLDPKHSIKIVDSAQVDAAKEYIRKYYSYPLRITGEEGQELSYSLGREFRDEIEENSVKKSIEVIRNRIDEFGVTEPEIVSMGSDRIVVQLPGVKDIERAKNLIGKTAKLEFKLVHDELASFGVGQVPAKLQKLMDDAKAAGIEYKRGERFSDYVAKMNEFYKELPKGHDLVFEKILNPVSNEVEALLPYVVESATNLTGEELQDATVRIDQQQNQPYVSLTFKSQGAALFEKLTGDNINRRLAIILDGNIYSAPNIQSRIAGGNAQITLGQGDYNSLLKQARDLSLVLRAGALPVELEFQEQRIVGPSLGADSIIRSEKAGLVAGLLVLIFIIVFYKVSGVIAVKTLIANIIFVLACLVGLEATLTLPGIAGIALTVGMAIDANIIIYERIKEELAGGVPVREAVGTGFSKAFWTILDANLTTAVAGLMLLNFGTGPIRGFAVTLIIGIACTVYTAYFVSKLSFEFYMDKTRGQKISI
ncbi:MAG: protein translocase subunit SecD [Bacteriovoracaceae bacterium]|jgi:protein-export membrane protein SecD|nr:protein translocase subunit SecD [Halobacteriovoraceae bacterium]MDP7321070.1 protein translocase subunit SecD [Bacteriovoracaceae bacterium]